MNIPKRFSQFKRQGKLFAKNIYDSILYRLDRTGKFPPNVKKVVFVCKGNICRSAFAEALMKSKNCGKLRSVESCGLEVSMSAWAPREAKITAKMFGLDIDGHLSKGWECCDLESADLILAMEYWQYRKLIKIFPLKRENIKLLREFTPFPENILCNISDPFGQNEGIFEKCFRQIERSIQNINDKI